MKMDINIAQYPDGKCDSCGKLCIRGVELYRLAKKHESENLILYLCPRCCKFINQLAEQVTGEKI